MAHIDDNARDYQLALLACSKQKTKIHYQLKCRDCTVKKGDIERLLIVLIQKNVFHFEMAHLYDNERHFKLGLLQLSKQKI